MVVFALTQRTVDLFVCWSSRDAESPLVSAAHGEAPETLPYVLKRASTIGPGTRTAAAHKRRREAEIKSLSDSILHFKTSQMPITPSDALI